MGSTGSILPAPPIRTPFLDAKTASGISLPWIQFLQQLAVPITPASTFPGLTGDVIAAQGSIDTTVEKIQGNSVEAGLPSDGDVLRWNAAAKEWAFVPLPENLNVTQQVGNYNASVGDVVLANSFLGGFTISLPAPTRNDIVIVKKISLDGNAVTVSAGSGVTIDGNPLFQITTPNESFSMVADGTNWRIIGDSGVPIPPGGGNDGLVHLDSVWEYDSAYIILRDDFLGGNSTTGSIGELGWTTLGVGVGGGTAFNVGNDIGGFPNVGQVLIQTGVTTASAGGRIVLPQGAAASGQPVVAQDSYLPLLDYPGWKLTFVFCMRLPSPKNQNGGTAAFNTSHSSLYIGLFSDVTPNGSVRPCQAFFGCRFDTDTTAPSIGDTTYQLEAVINAGTNVGATRYNNQGTNGGVFDTGIAPAANAWHRLEIIYASLGNMQILLDGVGAVFALTKPGPYTVNGGGFSISDANGVVNFPVTPTSNTNTNGNLVVAPGSQVTFSGLGGGFAVYNGTFGLAQPGVTATNLYFLDSSFGSTPTGNPGTYGITAYPGLVPFASFCNDTVATAPASLTRCLAADFFSYVWNGGLAGRTNPLPSKSRGW